MSLTGIQNLGQGAKRNDPLKTGQFGVGFNCVYNMTDNPTFTTTMRENGNKILAAFDPYTDTVSSPFF